MACGTCGGGSRARAVEYEVKTNAGGTFRVASISEAKIKLALHGGGTYRAVPKKA